MTSTCEMFKAPGSGSDFPGRIAGKHLHLSDIVCRTSLHVLALTANPQSVYAGGLPQASSQLYEMGPLLNEQVSVSAQIPSPRDSLETGRVPLS